MAADSSNTLTDLAAVAAAGNEAESNTALVDTSTETESATADLVDEIVAASEGPDSTKPGRSARDRIQQLVGANNQLTTELETLRAAEMAQTQSINNLTELINQSRADSEIINQIRTLAGDPKHSEMIRTLDRILSGDDEPVDTSKMSEEEKTNHANKILEQRIQTAEEMQAQVITDQLLNRADQIADRWLDNLPPEYTVDDKNVIGTLWTNMVDWDGLHATGDPNAHLEPHLRETLQEAIDLFKSPRGGLVATGSQESITEPEYIDPVEQLQEALAARPYGDIVTNEKGEPSLAITDDEFARDFAAVMKARQD